MIVQTWSEVILSSLQDLWQGFVIFLPGFLGAVVVFIIGWAIAATLGKVVTRGLQMVKIDQFFDQIGVMKALHTAGVQWEFSALLGALVKWFFVIAFFLAAVDIVGLTAVADFLQGVLLYIPKIIVAALILLVAVVLADFLEKTVRGSMKAVEFGASAFVAVVTRWAVWVFGILAALSQLGVATTLINTLFMGFVAMVAIAGGLAFGLGGQDTAKGILQKIRKDVSEN